MARKIEVLKVLEQRYLMVPYIAEMVLQRYQDNYPVTFRTRSTYEVAEDIYQESRSFDDE